MSAELQQPQTPISPESNGNGRVLGKIDLPKPTEQSLVVWFSCSVPLCTSRDFREHQAILPNMDFISSKVKRKVTKDDLRANVVCSNHANALEDRGVRCYYYLKTLGFMERQEEAERGLDAFMGDYNPYAARKQEIVSPPPKTPPLVEIPPGRGRDFDSPEASKPLGRRGGGHGDKKKRYDGWADRRN